MTKMVHIEFFVCKLRKKLDQATNGQNCIETVWGRGYTLREPDQDTAAKQLEMAS